ncbi:hypothetical protein [Nodosilinea nodulosa]|uniref:hypothetical protein n=1 Tax=Nodosilinea nodulosa TaxID=416001 RepID=UPI0008FB13FB|nr:hypothetical protein [Nodosilinea nodulosa]
MDFWLYQYMRFVNDGGPLLILPDEALRLWKGGDARSSAQARSELIAATGRYSQTDYDVACQTEDTVSPLDIDSSWGLVIGADEDVPSSRWVPLLYNRKILFLGVYSLDLAPSQEFLNAEVDQSEGWFSLGRFNTENKRLNLIHAASNGSDDLTEPYGIKKNAFIGNRLCCKVDSGEYEVAWKVLQDFHYCLLLVRFIAF